LKKLPSHIIKMQKMFFKLRCVFIFMSLAMEVKMFGTTLHLFDVHSKMNIIDHQKLVNVDFDGVEVKTSGSGMRSLNFLQICNFIAMIVNFRS
jgi:hypothetical protein